MYNDSLVKKLAQSVKLFSGLAHDDIREFLANCRRRDVAPGEAVICQGEYGSEMFVIVSGLLEVQQETSADVHVLAALEPGDVFGELAILDQLPRSATVRAVSQSIVLMFDRGSLVRIPLVVPKLFRNIALILSERLRDTNEMLSITLSTPRAPVHAESIAGRRYRTRSIG